MAAPWAGSVAGLGADLMRGGCWFCILVWLLGEYRVWKGKVEASSILERRL
jgi:hypothetical protein